MQPIIAISTTATVTAPLAKRGYNSAKELLNRNCPLKFRNSSAPVSESGVAEAPAATFRASGQYLEAHQHYSQKRLGVARASAKWNSISSQEAKLRTPQEVTFGAPPNNWKHLKKDLVKYLSGAEKNQLAQNFACRSKGVFHLDRSGDPISPTNRIIDYPAPGCISVSMHGISPVNRKTGGIKDFRKETPFWDDTNRSLTQPFDEGLRSTAQVVRQLDLDPAEDAPIFLNTCNAGTESQGYTPAADMAKQTGRYVIAPVNTRVIGSVRGPRLADSGGEWRAFHPDGTSELIFRPASK